MRAPSLLKGGAFTEPVCVEATDKGGNKSTKECKSTAYITPKITNFFNNEPSVVSPDTHIVPFLTGSNGGTAHTYIAQSFTPAENMTIQNAITDHFFGWGHQKCSLESITRECQAI